MGKKKLLGETLERDIVSVKVSKHGMIHIGDIVFHTVTAPQKNKKSLEENKHQYIEKATFLSRKNRAFKQTLKVTKKLYTPKI